MLITTSSIDACDTGSERGRACEGAIAAPACQVSIVVPTRNEAGNLPTLLERIAGAMEGRTYEVLVIDDGSQDDTVAVCRDLACEHPLRLHVRERPLGGLGGAVLHGFSLARGQVLVVMDADLQHPPERLPALIAPVLTGEADLVVGSRHVAGGSIAHPWGAFRRLQSAAARLLAQPLVGPVRDIMSGFLALRRDVYENAESLSPLGYKIGLELLCKCPACRIAEVPIEFGMRLHGHSKLTVSQRLKYLVHLARLYEHRCRSYVRTRLAYKTRTGLKAGSSGGLYETI